MIEPDNLIRQLIRARIYEDFERAFEKTTKLPLELSSIGMRQEVHRGRSKYANPFCAILARTKETCDACLDVQRKITDAARSDTRTLRCFAGFTYTSVPVKWDNRVIGFLQTGEVLLRSPSAERFRRITAQLTSWGVKVDFVRLENAYLRSRTVSPDQYHAIVRLLEIFAEHLSLVVDQSALRQWNDDSFIVRRAKGYIASHQSAPIKLEEIARAINISTFHFCRKFKQETGLTFVTYLSRARIERAKMLLHNKDLRITEIAYEVGFQSLTHFNRTFHKFVAQSPTEYRSSVSEAI